MAMHPDKLSNILQLPSKYNFFPFPVIAKRENLVTELQSQSYGVASELDQTTNRLSEDFKKILGDDCAD